MRKKSLERLYKQADDYDEKYLKAMHHAADLYEDRRKLADTLHEFLSFNNRGAFKLTNAHSKRVWLRQLIPSFLEYKHTNLNWKEALDQGFVAVALVTFTHEEWACPDTAVEFNLEKAKQKVRNALAPLHYIACFEAAYYVNEEWERDGKVGNLINFHCHAVVWAEHKTQLQRMQMKTAARFTPILGNKKGVHLKSIGKVSGACKALRYQAKMPHRGYKTVEKEGGKIRQKWVPLSHRQHYRLFLALQNYDLLDVWLAGGDGAYILREARAGLEPFKQEARSSRFGRVSRVNDVPYRAAEARSSLRNRLR